MQSFVQFPLSSSSFSTNPVPCVDFEVGHVGLESGQEHINVICVIQLLVFWNALSHGWVISLALEFKFEFLHSLFLLLHQHLPPSGIFFPFCALASFSLGLHAIKHVHHPCHDVKLTSRVAGVITIGKSPSLLPSGFLLGDMADFNVWALHIE